MMKHHFITSLLLLLAFARVAASGVADTTIFEGKLVDSLTDEMMEHMPDIETSSRLRFFRFRTFPVTLIA